MTTTEPGTTPGLLPQQIAEAERRLERCFTRRWNARTAYQNRRKWVRLLAFQATCPDRPLGEQAQAWLSTIPVSQQAAALPVLKFAFGATACDWSALVIRHYRRDEPRLFASVLREDARAKIRAGRARAARVGAD
jgi:hypothetical protein